MEKCDVCKKDRECIHLKDGMLVCVGCFDGGFSGASSSGGSPAAGKGQRACSPGGPVLDSERRGKVNEKKLSPEEWGKRYCPGLWNEIAEQVEMNVNFEIYNIYHITWNIMTVIKYEFLGRVEESGL